MEAIALQDKEQVKLLTKTVLQNLNQNVIKVEMVAIINIMPEKFEPAFAYCN